MYVNTVFLFLLQLDINIKIFYLDYQKKGNFTKK